VFRTDVRNCQDDECIRTKIRSYVTETCRDSCRIKVQAIPGVISSSVFMGPDGRKSRFTSFLYMPNVVYDTVQLRLFSTGQG